jgi:phage FluMu gp28-like protein
MKKQPTIEELDKIDRKYFLDFQSDVILEEARLNLIEKSIRIGITFSEAMRAVRRRMLGLGNLLHTSVNENIAKAFITDCRKFNRLYDVVGASEVKESEVWNEFENRKETAYRIDYKKQDVSIEVFSSNPDSIRGKGGEVNIDELTSHKRSEDMLQAAGGRAMWGYPLNIWSSHKGMNSGFNRLIKEQRALGDKSRWKIKTITLYDALDAGLLEKINQVSGSNMTRENFIEDTKAMVGGEDAFAEECLCQPRASGLQAIKWQYIDVAKRTYPLVRKHIEGDETFDVADWFAPVASILPGFSKIALGYDVARTGHLSSVPVLGFDGTLWRHLSLLTMHARKFRLQFADIVAIMGANKNMVGAGDATGLGMETCENLTDTFGEGRFLGVNFSADKTEIGTKMVRVFEDGAIALSDARNDEDIVFDLAAIQIDASSKLTKFVETANPVNKLSHCDIAWSIGLALFVGQEDRQPGIVTL